ncbi:Uncharacterised protein [Mycobacteroides abscessus subsp. abscessus]|nr:Uncharacterised protein [Mycobacteroides abscessus subsp. abscessus]
MGVRPTALSAAPTDGSKGAATSVSDTRRGLKSGGVSCPDGKGDTATVGPCAVSRSMLAAERWLSPSRVAPRRLTTPRIWSRTSAAPVVAWWDRPSSAISATASRLAWA